MTHGPLDPARRARQIAPGVLACILAGGLGAAVWAVFLGILLYLLAFMPKRRDTLVALIGAPFVLALGSPVPTLLEAYMVAWILVLVAALVPLFLVLGGALPWRPVPLVTGGALLLALGILLARWTPLFVGTDLGTRAQVLVLAAATLVVYSVAPYLRRDDAQRREEAEVTEGKPKAE